ncbi:uncharacterized protein [Nicotiana sylvestris]|uniref:uncharacterized protein n=1 Tax=Nicotiana sylvestris TaxID=4096 RepID=UPI00388CA89B
MGGSAGLRKNKRKGSHQLHMGSHHMPIRNPSEITCDNGRQFIESKVTQFLEDDKIKRILSTPYHLCANGQAESTNKTIIQNFKKKLESTKGKWRETLPDVLWAYRTTSKSSTGEMPFSLVYSAEALIPVEVADPSARFQHTNEGSNNEHDNGPRATR